MKSYQNLKERIDIDLNENLAILTLLSIVGLVGDNPKFFMFRFLKNEIVLGVIFVIFLWHTIILNNEKRKLLKKVSKNKKNKK